ncbi:MAG: hypothetical protein ACTSVB_03265 [Candidatus Heimdallarchaeaceae archaeon]
MKRRIKRMIKRKSNLFSKNAVDRDRRIEFLVLIFSIIALIVFFFQTLNTLILIKPYVPYVVKEKRVPECEGIELHQVANGGFESWNELDGSLSAWWVSGNVQKSSESKTGSFSVLLDGSTSLAQVSSRQTAIAPGDYNFSFCYRALEENSILKIVVKDSITGQTWDFETSSWTSPYSEKVLRATTQWKCFSTSVHVNDDQDPSLIVIFKVTRGGGKVLVDEVAFYKMKQSFTLSSGFGTVFQIKMWHTVWTTNPPSFGFTDQNITTVLKELHPDIVRINPSHAELILGYSENDGFELNFSKLDTALSWLSENLPNTKIMLTIIPKTWWFESGGGPLPDSIKHPILNDSYGFSYLRDDLFYDLVYEIAHHMQEKDFHIDYWGILNEVYHTIKPYNESKMEAFIKNYNNGTSAVLSVFPNADVSTLNLGYREHFDHFLKKAIIPKKSYVSVHKGADWTDSFQEAIELAEFWDNSWYDPQRLLWYWQEKSQETDLIMDEGSAVKPELIESMDNKTFFASTSALIMKYALLNNFDYWLHLSFGGRYTEYANKGSLFNLDEYIKHPSFYAVKLMKSLEGKTIIYSNPGFNDKISKLAWTDGTFKGLLLINKNNQEVNFNFSTQSCVSGLLNISLITNNEEVMENFLINSEYNQTLNLGAFNIALIKEEDLNSICGNGVCDTFLGENSQNCNLDCEAEHPEEENGGGRSNDNNGDGYEENGGNNNNKSDSERCQENWSCGPWSECINGTRTRTCTDLNHCNTTLHKPSEKETCSVTTSVCGNGICESGENEQNCPEDCKIETPKKLNKRFLLVLNIAFIIAVLVLIFIIKVFKLILNPNK